MEQMDTFLYVHIMNIWATKTNFYLLFTFFMSQNCDSFVFTFEHFLFLAYAEYGFASFGKKFGKKTFHWPKLFLKEVRFYAFFKVAS